MIWKYGRIAENGSMDDTVLKLKEMMKTNVIIIKIFNPVDNKEQSMVMSAGINLNINQFFTILKFCSFFHKDLIC